MYDPDMILALSHQRRRELEAEIADARLASSARSSARSSRPSLGASASAALHRFRSALHVPAKHVTVKQV